MTSQPPVEAVLDHEEAAAAVSGTRSGALLGAASVVSIAANYVFLLAAGRILGSADYGSLAALLGLLAVVLLPAGALQLAVSREISRLVAGGDLLEADAFARATLQSAALATGPLLALACVLAYPLSHVLNIDSVGVVALAEITLITALVYPTALGVLQGRQRFHALAGLYVFPWVLRLALLAASASAGYHLGGALLATVAAAIASAGAALALIRRPLRHARGVKVRSLRPFLRYLGPVAIGIVGIALLTHIDILVVKARFSADDAGAYGAASAFARVAFFVPATILAVLFPRTAARQARGEETEDILGRSLLATAGFCALLVVFYAAAGEGLVATTFGADFASGGRVLAPYAFAMGLFSLAQVLVGYHLSRGETRYAWIVAGGVVVQVAVLAVVPTTLRGVVWSNLAVGTGLLAAHELLVGSSLPAVRAGLRHFLAAAGVRVRSLAVEGLLALIGATTFVCLLFWPMTTRIGSTVVGRGSDSSGGVWWFWQLQHEGGYHLFGTTHHVLTGAPFGWDQGNGLNIQWLVPYYPAYLATKVVGAVAAYNLVLLSGYVLSALTMYLLVRYLGCAPAVAAWAGLVYVVFPSHIARTPHASLVHLEFLPVVLLALVAAARRPTWSRFLLVGVATAACWLTSGYFGAMAVVTSGAFALGAGLTMARRRAALVIAGAMSTAIVGSAFVAFLSALAGVGRAVGARHDPIDLSVYGLRALELVSPAFGNLVFGGRLDDFLGRHMHGSNPTETSNDLGVLTIVLALTWVVIASRSWRALAPRLRAATAGLLFVAVTALLLGAPSPVVVLGHRIWAPSRLVWEVLPAVRVPSRWVVLVMSALVPIAALALQTGWRRLDPAGRGRPAAVALVGVAMVVSFLELTISPARPRFSTNHVPAVYAALERTPGGILAEYPLGQSADYLIWQSVHGRPLFNSDEVGTPPGDAERVLFDPAMPGTAAQLAFLGVTAIITHPNALDFPRNAPDVANASWGSGYALVARSRDGSSVWRVVAQPAPALVTLPSGFGDAEPQAEGSFGFPLDSSSGVGYLELRAKRAGIVRLAFAAVPPQGAKRTLRIAGGADERPFTLAGRTQVSLLVQVPRGLSRLLVKTDPAPTSDADAIVLSGVRTASAAGAPELRSEPISPSIGF